MSYFTYDHQGDDEFQMAFNNGYNIFALTQPESMDFAGETVPLNDPEIRERLDRELLVNTYWQSQTLLFFKRAHRDFAVIEPILRKHGVPDDFKYLALIESGLMNVVSPAGATGVWQIMEGTGKEYGLEITKEVDERYHLEKSTEAACRYLKNAYQELGNWTLAAASYNMGLSGVKKQLERQRGESYYDLTLNTETGRYLFRIMAVREILENPKTYGFHFREKDLYPVIPTRQLAIDSSVNDLGLLAEELGINYRILKYHNPWLRYHYLPNYEGRTYTLQIPLEGHYELSPNTPPPPDSINKTSEELPEPISDTATLEEEKPD